MALSNSGDGGGACDVSAVTGDRAMPPLAHTISINYLGAETLIAYPKGLRVYQIKGYTVPIQVPPPLSLKRYWTRRVTGEWLVQWLGDRAARRYRPGSGKGLLRKARRTPTMAEWLHFAPQWHRLCRQAGHVNARPATFPDFCVTSGDRWCMN